VKCPRPSPLQSDDIEKHGFDEYAVWYLGAGQRKYLDVELAVTHQRS
jgi:hypothetical protein